MADLQRCLKLVEKIRYAHSAANIDAKDAALFNQTLDRIVGNVDKISKSQGSVVYDSADVEGLEKSLTQVNTAIGKDLKSGLFDCCLKSKAAKALAYENITTALSTAETKSANIKQSAVETNPILAGQQSTEQIKPISVNAAMNTPVAASMPVELPPPQPIPALPTSDATSNKDVHPQQQGSTMTSGSMSFENITEADMAAASSDSNQQSQDQSPVSPKSDGAADQTWVMVPNSDPAEPTTAPPPPPTMLPPTPPPPPPSTRVYEGDKNPEGRCHGTGVMRYENGAVYTGEWVNGKREGHGMYTWSNGDIYEGSWSNDNRNGKGVQKSASGGVYEGEWADGKRCGNGTMSYENGNVYTGEYLDNKFHGRGVYTFNNGDVYKGEFQQGLYFGHGEFVFSNGDSYTGLWKQDKKLDKHGIYKYANGNVYEGGFKDDLKHGKGIFKYASGDVYDGDWKTDVKQGWGKYTWASGNFREGRWNADQFVPDEPK